MSRNLLRSSPWSTTDHICLSCRRQLSQQSRKAIDISLRRAWNSTQSSETSHLVEKTATEQSATEVKPVSITRRVKSERSAAARGSPSKTVPNATKPGKETDLETATKGRSIAQALFSYKKKDKRESTDTVPAPWDIQHDWTEKPTTDTSKGQYKLLKSRNVAPRHSGPRSELVRTPRTKKDDSDAEGFGLVSKKLPVFEATPAELVVEPLDIDQPSVPPLAHGLDRVLFNPNIYLLQDPHSGVYNFDPYLEDIMPVNEFDFAALPAYKTSSEDSALSQLAAEHNARYVGSTSSMTGALCHFHYLLSHFRQLNFNMLSQDFRPDSKQVTKIYRAPYSIFLRYKNGSYAIDADKEHDSPNVLMMLGKSLEKLLTLEKDDMERYRKSGPGEVTKEEREAVDAFQYTTMGNMLMRSQLDAYDPRLPGNGTFDLKTRAVLPIRHSAREFEDMLGYELKTLRGQFESYEREYYDMARATMLKYMLQARMGKMDGIFVAYHNVERIFGFQYLPMHELDRVLHGTTDPTLGDGEFKLSLKMFNHLLDMATNKFPEQSLRVVFEASGRDAGADVLLRVFAEPLTEAEIHEIQSSKKKLMAAYEDRMQNGMSQKEALQYIMAEQAKELAEDEAEEESETTDAEVSDEVAQASAEDEAVQSADETTAGDVLEPTDDTVNAADTTAPSSDQMEQAQTSADGEPTTSSPAEAGEIDSVPEEPTMTPSADANVVDPVPEQPPTGPSVKASEADAVLEQPSTAPSPDANESDAAVILAAADQEAKSSPKPRADKVKEPLKPLFAVSVIVEHTINKYVGLKRPDALTAEDEWKVKYAIRDHAEKNLAGAWALYRSTQKTRADAFTNTGEEDNVFFRELHRMVSSGREYREALEKAQEGSTPIIWTPLTPKSPAKDVQA